MPFFTVDKSLDGLEFVRASTLASMYLPKHVDDFIFNALYGKGTALSLLVGTSCIILSIPFIMDLIPDYAFFPVLAVSSILNVCYGAHYNTATIKFILWTFEFWLFFAFNTLFMVSFMFVVAFDKRSFIFIFMYPGVMLVGCLDARIRKKVKPGAKRAWEAPFLSFSLAALAWNLSVLAIFYAGAVPRISQTTIQVFALEQDMLSTM